MYGAYGAVDLAAAQSQLAAWQRVLHGLVLTLQRARAARNAAMEAQVRSGITAVLGYIRALREQIEGREMPSSFMRALDAFSDQALTVARDVGGVALDVGKGAASTVKILPLALLGIIAVLGIGLFKGTLSVRR